MDKERIVLLLLIIIIIPLYLFTIFSSEHTVANWFTTDDAFYYFKVAENITEGKGITFDGISKTNGFHPLWMVVVTPIFSLARYDLFLPLRGVIAVQMFLAMGTGILFFKLIERVCSTPVAFLMSLIWVLLPDIQGVTSNGTEAGLNAFLITLLWFKVADFDPRAEVDRSYLRKVLSLGFVALLLVFSRLDNVYLVLPVGLWLIYLYVRTRYTKDDGLKLKEMLRIGFSFFAPVVVFLAAYLTFNYLHFGMLTPVSGQVKQWWGTLDKTVYGTPVRGVGNYLAEFFSPDPNIGPWSLFTRRIFSFADRFVAHYFYGTRAVSLGLLIEIGAALIIGFLMALKKEYVVRTLHDLALYPLLAGTVLHISHYKLLGYLAPKAWYWIAEMFVLVLLVTIFMEVVYRLIYDTEIKLLKWIPRFLVILGVGFILKPHLEYIAHAFRKLERVESQYYLRKTDWLEDHTEAGALIGMTGAGSTSYFVNDRTIINLDGLVNGKTYFEHLRKGKIIEYVQDVGVDYIFGNSYLIKEREPYQSSLGVYLDDGANPVFNDQLTLWDLEK